MHSERSLETCGKTTWHPAGAHPELRSGDVHLWRAAFTRDAIKGEDCLHLDEWVRADRYHFARDRDRFIWSRSTLRQVLGRYLNCDPCVLRFASGQNGKPELVEPFSTLKFNLSHSSEILLLAVTHARDVGVDVEYMRGDVPFDMLAEHFFTSADARSIRELPEGEKARGFYDLWTGTEAVLKAAGLGLAQATGPARFDRWRLHRLTPAEGYAGAIAVEGKDFELACWSWPP